MAHFNAEWARETIAGILDYPLKEIEVIRPRFYPKKWAVHYTAWDGGYLQIFV